MNAFYLFMILDMNQIFGYHQPTESPYYVEACQHSELYIKLLQRFARWHAHGKLERVYETSSLIGEDHETFLSTQKELVGEEEERQEVGETVKSQRYMNSFLNFLCNLLSYKNRALQN